LTKFYLCPKLWVRYIDRTRIRVWWINGNLEEQVKTFISKSQKIIFGKFYLCPKLWVREEELGFGG
jgi:hypothetical protein